MKGFDEHADSSEWPRARNPRALDAASKVIPFPKAPGGNFSNLTAAILLQKFRSGTLDEAVFLALMANAGLRP